MKYSDKKILFAEFLDLWESELMQIGSIVKYLSTFTASKTLFPKSKLIEPENLFEHQLEWIALCAQQTHPEEKRFMKNYWVPIEKDNYDFFLDLSTKPYKIFEIDFHCSLRYTWYKIPVGKNVIDIMSIMSSSSLVSNLVEDKLILKLAKTKYFFENTARKGLYGKLNPLEYISELNFFSGKPILTRRNYTIEIKNIYRSGILLLPQNLEISEIVGVENKYVGSVKNTGGLLFLLTQLIRQNDVDFYVFANFKNHSGFLEYSKNTLKINYNLSEVLDEIEVNFGKRKEEFLSNKNPI